MAIFEKMPAQADKNLPDEYGTTPLHLAALTDNFEVCRAIVDQVADVRPIDDFGMTPLDLARRSRAVLLDEEDELPKKMGRPRRIMRIGQLNAIISLLSGTVGPQG